MKNTNTPPKTLFIGICGGSGSGKSTLSQALIHALPRGLVTLISLDAYYRQYSEVPDAVRGNFDHPDSLDGALLAKQLQDLRAGQAVLMPRYDFTCHDRFPTTERVEPTPVILLDGILLFALPTVLAQLDVSIFVDAPADIRLARRLRRDMRERGRTMDDVLMQYFATVRPMHELYVETYKHQSDLLVSSMDDLDDEVEVVLHYLKKHHWLKG